MLLFSFQLELVSFGVNSRCYAIDDANHVYIVVKIRKTVHLSCVRSNNETDKCPGTAFATPHYSKGKLFTMTNMVPDTPHNHDSDVADAHNIKLQHACFMKLEDNPDENFTSIFNEEREK